jgi:hypothetical protein
VVASQLVRSPRGCVPRDISSGGALVNGADLTIQKGQVLYVVLEEPAEPGPVPNSFPWPTPTSSNPRILKRVPLCKHLDVSTVALTITAFRAIGTGTATVTAPLSRAWHPWEANPHQVVPSTPREPFQSFRASVTVASN